MSQEECNLVIGALDSLGVALADRNHQWSEGERAIYEAAVECVGKAVHIPVEKLEGLRAQVSAQGENGTWNLDPYMNGMFNGLDECALATLEDREPSYRDAPVKWLKDIPIADYLPTTFAKSDSRVECGSSVLLPCPFCGEPPVVLPENPARDGSAWAEVRCVNSDCPAQPRVRDGERAADERGSDAYKAAAIRRWNIRLAR